MRKRLPFVLQAIKKFGGASSSGLLVFRRARLCFDLCGLCSSLKGHPFPCHHFYTTADESSFAEILSSMLSFGSFKSVLSDPRSQDVVVNAVVAVIVHRTLLQWSPCFCPASSASLVRNGPSLLFGQSCHQSGGGQAGGPPHYDRYDRSRAAIEWRSNYSLSTADVVARFAAIAGGKVDDFLEP